MHDDRKLLELAANAAGLLLCGYSWIGENEDDEECEILEAAFVKHHQEQELASKWNPLTDDGDALRLAASLELEVSLGRHGSIIYMKGGIKIGEISDDYMQAARLAIVRASAAIGEAMQ